MTDPLEATLLPCPFCGSSPEMGEDEDGLCAVMCLNKNCYVTGPGREEASNAVSSWNRRALLAREQAVAGWQPIETAPRDGARILAYLLGEADEAVDVVRWDDEGWRHATGVWPVTPTHWQPLPAPPGQEQPPSPALPAKEPT